MRDICRNKEKRMKIEEMISLLRRRFPKFSQKLLYDVDNKGNEFCEMIYPNESNPSMPITVSISESGCLISVGQISHVTGDRPIPIEHAISAMEDIIADRIVFVLGYNDGDDIGSGAPFMTELYAITGDVDDMSEELEKFIEKVKKPLKGIWRKLSSLKGRFVITDFSGSRFEEIIR